MRQFQIAYKMTIVETHWRIGSTNRHLVISGYLWAPHHDMVDEGLYPKVPILPDPYGFGCVCVLAFWAIAKQRCRWQRILGSGRWPNLATGSKRETHPGTLANS